MSVPTSCYAAGEGRAPAFIYRSSAIAGFDHHDLEQHKRLLLEAYAGQGWCVPELLDRVRAAENLSCDSASRVRIPRWSHGRVALVGDAASCVSLFGDGSSLGMAGAFVLADELAATPDDPSAACARYERRHRRLVDPRQRTVSRGAAVLVPATRAGIVVCNTATRLWPVAAAANRYRLLRAP